jgi:hypothetical protein
MLSKKQRKLFIDLFDDLSVEIEECGYEGAEDQLIGQMMSDHLDLFMEDDRQLKMLGDYIMKHQGQIATKVKSSLLYMGVR